MYKFKVFRIFRGDALGFFLRVGFGLRLREISSLVRLN